MTLPAFYSDGTVTVENGSTTVVGSGTDFTQMQAGDEFVVNAHGLYVEISAIDNANQLTLVTAYPGVNASAQAYRIRRSLSGARVTEQTRRLLERLGNGLYAQPTAYGEGGAGSGSDRDQYDGVDPANYTGDIFIYWDIAENPFEIWVKASSLNGDWAGPFTIQGPTGATGAAGTGDAYDIIVDDPGKPGAGEVLLKHIFANVVEFPLNLSGSFVSVGVNPTASAEYSFTKNGTEFATLTISTGGVGTFAGSATTFGAGDILRVVAPNPRDDTLSGVSMTLAGSRS